MPQFDRRTEDPNFRATRHNDIVNDRDPQTTIAAGGAAVVTDYTNQSDSLQQIGYVSLAQDGGYERQVVGNLYVYDDAGTDQYQVSGHLPAFPLNLDPQFPLPPGWQTRLEVHNPSSASVDVQGAIVLTREN